MPSLWFLDFSVVLLLPFLSSTLLASLDILGRRLARHLQLACYAVLQRSLHTPLLTLLLLSAPCVWY